MLKKIAKKIINVSSIFGIDLIKLFITLYNFPNFIIQFLKLFSNKKNDFSFSFYPILVDKFMEAGTTKSQYFHQDLYIARKIYKDKPKDHYDIGSRIDGFVAHVASFRKINIIDIRPLKNKIHNVSFFKKDIMQENQLLDFKIDSLSSLHAVEHFGLGRYGDKIEYDGHLVGLNNIFKMLNKNGKFYFSVPIGPNKICFNAHRIFSIDYLLKYIMDKYELIEFSYVDDRGSFHENFKINEFGLGILRELKFGLGIFILKKN
tara:strand:+ start:1458 stop:2240 length:783 start_codon:yes stop_codon:yes gene_type:complete